MRATRPSRSRLTNSLLGSARGLTMMEMMVASVVTTMLSGVLLLMARGGSEIYSNKIIGVTLEGEQDATFEQLKKDIWRARAVRDADPATPVPACPGPPTFTTRWLCLDMNTPNFTAPGPVKYGNGDIRYILQGTGIVVSGGPPPVIQLVRQVWRNGAWTQSRTLANNLVLANTVASASSATVNNPLAPALIQRSVTLSIANQRTDTFGRVYQRTVQNVTYRLQTPE